MINGCHKVGFCFQIIRKACAVATIAMLTSSASVAVDLGEISRSMRNANEISRHSKTIYDRVQSISKASTAKRKDTLPADGKNVVLYSASWCGNCNKARDYMSNNGVPFVEYDIEKSAKGRADFETLNARGVPVLLIGDERMTGWGESKFRQLHGKFQASGTATPMVTGTASRKPAVVNGSGMALPIDSGTVLAAKIDNVAVFASSSSDAEVLTRLKKGEEVVAADRSVGDMVAVESAAGHGWVKTTLVRAQEQ